MYQMQQLPDIYHNLKKKEKLNKPEKQDTRYFILKYKKMDEEFKKEDSEEVDEEILELMENHGLDQDEAEHVKEIMDTEGLDEEEAVELKDDL